MFLWLCIHGNKRAIKTISPNFLWVPVFYISANLVFPEDDQSKVP